MDGLLILYVFSFVPLNGPYAPALSTAREAGFRQWGISQQWHTARRAAERKLPAAAQPIVFVATTAKKGELRVKSTALGTWSIRKDRVELNWGFQW